MQTLKSLDTQNPWRDAFPALSHNPNLVYLDSGASALKPQAVIDAMSKAMSTYYANIHRGLYKNSQESTARYEAARRTVCEFLKAKENEIIFTRNATESINLVAQSWGRANLNKDDVILITALEHHANIVPWQMIAQERGAIVKIISINAKGEVSQVNYQELLSAHKPKLVALNHVSNALGSVQPVVEMINAAKAIGAKTLIDGAQAVVHSPVDVKALGCDFYVFSGHKLYGPSGIGVLYGRYDMLEAMPPYQGGGDMIETVGFETSTYALPPARFEAGTPAIVEAIGLAAAIDWLEAQGWDAIQAHEADLLRYGTELLEGIDGLTMIGTAENKAAILSFVLDGCSPQDVGILLDEMDIAVRVGHHCAMPLMAELGLTATIRASLGVYNTRGDLDKLAEGLRKIVRLLG